VISFKIQEGITNQRNKWAITDPRIDRRWDHVQEVGAGAGGGSRCLGGVSIPEITKGVVNVYLFLP
jgi:hypothetical protein